MKRGIRAARSAVKDYLGTSTQPVPLFTLSVVADNAARKAGARKSDLFEHLDPYQGVLPRGWTVRWLNDNGDRYAEGMLYAVPSECGQPYDDGKLRDYRPIPGPFDITV